MSDLLQKSLAYIASQGEQAPYHGKRDRRAGPTFVTISRQSGAYGMAVAEKLVEHLLLHERRKHAPWTAFDRNLLQKVIEEHHFPKSVLPYFSENTVSEIQDTMDEIFGLHPSKWTLVHRMSETILHLAQLGYVVLVGRGATFITRKLPNGVHVRFIGSLQKRIERVREVCQLTEKEAKARIALEERGRRQFVQRYFDADIDSPSQYDLVLNMDSVSVGNAVEIIAALVLKRGSGQ